MTIIWEHANLGNRKTSAKKREDLSKHYLFEQWKCSVKMANRHNERRLTINAAFFLPLMFVVLWLESQLLFSNEKLMIEYALMSVGAAFGCLLWLASIAKHKNIARVKYQAINSLEAKLSISIYSDEYQSFKGDWKDKLFKVTEHIIPLLLLAFFVFCICFIFIKRLN